MEYFPQLKDISRARLALNGTVMETPLTGNAYLSEHYGANVLFKREDLQTVRSYKIRGAINKIKSLTPGLTSAGIVCASAGNHAQGVALSCNKLRINGTVYMPTTTPKQKVDQVKMFGREFVEVILTGDTFDAANAEALKYCKKTGKTFIPPFDDKKVIEGQGTMGIEILQECRDKVDYLFVPVGGGGLAAGVGALFRHMSPDTKIIGVEPSGAASMRAAFDAGHVVELANVDKFIDGAAVKKVGELTYQVCREVLDDRIAVPEGAGCTTILDLYNKNAIVAEPAGALPVAARGQDGDRFKGGR